MSVKIFKCTGGEIVLPGRELVLVDAGDGGNLIVNPPRRVWERSELTPGELAAWSFLVAAAGKAMLESLPQLRDGCLNYWEAGNWALNRSAEPMGVTKTAKKFRQVHLHLLGRNPRSANQSLEWGEAPMFPKFVDRFRWAENNKRLGPEECLKIVTRVKVILIEIYGFEDGQIEGWSSCPGCKYPIAEPTCPECRQI
jgi:hypothetical protein